MPSLRLVVALAVAAAVAGCTAPDAQDVPQPAPPVAMPLPWSQSGNVSLGWVVGLGADNFSGDTTVGLTSHDVCPRHLFIVPRGTTFISIGWQAPSVQADRPGAGYYTLVISQPEEIHFIESELEEGAREWADPPAGVWEVKVQARGASYNLLWPLEVAMQGEGDPEPLRFFHDGDCLQD
jgi:hypothetical protein